MFDRGHAAEEWDAKDERLGAVYGVEVPAVTGRAELLAVLLAEDGVGGTFCVKDAPRQLLALLVGAGHGRAVRLEVESDVLLLVVGDGVRADLPHDADGELGAFGEFAHGTTRIQRRWPGSAFAGCRHVVPFRRIAVKLYVSCAPGTRNAELRPLRVPLARRDAARLHGPAGVEGRAARRQCGGFGRSDSSCGSSSFDLWIGNPGLPRIGKSNELNWKLQSFFDFSISGLRNDCRRSL